MAACSDGLDRLVRGRYKASLEIRDKDVEAQLELHKPDQKIDVGYEYIMRPVVFIVARGSPDAVYEARKREAEALRARFVNCNDGIPLRRLCRTSLCAIRCPKSSPICPATSRHSRQYRQSAT